jgi:CheY-like chemotaxis protein
MPVRKANVLVVDDKRANLIALEALLGERYNILFASSGEEAISLLEKPQNVDVILMDVQMPAMDGFETAARIKKLRSCQDIPIIFITAVYSEDPHIKRGYEVGGIDYFTKPFDPAILKLKLDIYASFRLKSELLRERELHIRESEELLRVGRKLSTLLESLPVGVLIADVEGRICQATDEVSRILKCQEPVDHDAYGEMLGWWDAAGRTLKSEHSPLGRAIREGHSAHRERLQIQCFDGTAKTILVSTAPLRGLDGRIVGAVILIQDLTEKTKIEEDFESRVTKLIALGVEIEESVTR